MFRQGPWILLAVTGLMVNWGCGGTETDVNRLPVYPVTGTITNQGKPVQDAHVTFHPVDQGRGAFGRTDQDGRYQLRTYEEGDGALPGEYIVTVTKMVDENAGEEPATDIDATREPPKFVSMVPEGFSKVDQSKLRATVQATGINSFDFPLD